VEYQVNNEKGFETWEEFLKEWERIKKFREHEKPKTKGSRYKSAVQALPTQIFISLLDTSQSRSSSRNRRNKLLKTLYKPFNPNALWSQ